MLYELSKSLSRKQHDKVLAQLKASKTDQAKAAQKLHLHFRRVKKFSDNAVQTLLDRSMIRKHHWKVRALLKETILEVLAQQHRDPLLEQLKEVSIRIRQAQILYGRGFGEEAIADMRRLEQTTGSTAPGLKLMIMEEHHRMLRSHVTEGREDTVKAHGNLIKDQLNTYSLRKAYERLDEEAFRLYVKRRSISNDQMRKKVENLLHHPLMLNIDTAPCFEAKKSFLMVRIMAGRLLNNHQDKVENMELMVKLWDDHPEHIRRSPYVYKRMMINLLNGYYHIGYRERFESMYKKATSVELNNKKEQSASAIAMLSAKVLYLINCRQLNEANNMEQELKNGTEEHLDLAPLSSSMNLMFNIGSMYFLCADNSLSRKWYQRVVNQRTTTRLDLQCTARVMLLLCDMYTDPAELVLSNVRNTANFLKQNNRLGEVERVVLRCLRKLVKDSVNHRSGHLIEAITQLERMGLKNSDQLGGEAIMYWIEANLKNRTVREVFEFSAISA